MDKMTIEDIAAHFEVSVKSIYVYLSKGIITPSTGSQPKYRRTEQLWNRSAVLACADKVRLYRSNRYKRGSSKYSRNRIANSSAFDEAMRLM